ncbi:MAG: hypothetical protein Kow00124_32450 [Anaerolineae bacterium]
MYDILAGYSNYGAPVTLVAPGEQIAPARLFVSWGLACIQGGGALRSSR